MEFATWLTSNDDLANRSPRIEPCSTSPNFEAWFFTNGGYIHPSIELASRPSSGNFLRVMAENIVPPASTIVSCPHSLALSWPSARKFHYPEVQLPPYTQHVATRLFLMKQKLLKGKSPWWPYIKMLPDTFNTPLYYDSEDFAWIRGTNLGRARKVREDAWQEEYGGVMRTLLPKDIAEEQRKLWTWDLYLWAATVMSSRSFPGPAVFNQPEGIYPTYSDNPEGKAPVLIPGLDLLNHIPSSRIAWLWDTTACTIKTDELLSGGSEVPNNYGPKSNEELIMGYGFSLPDNPADHFSIGFAPAIATYINATKARRSIDSDGRLPETPDSQGQGTLEATSNHWVCIRNTKPEFSPHFLEDFSIALENPRECHMAELCPQSGFDLLDAPHLRNKLHVLCAILMILEKGQLAIRKHDGDLPERPQNAKQLDAARYRYNQLDILDCVIDSLTRKLCLLSRRDRIVVEDIPIVRLEDALADCPTRLLKDFRSVLNTGMKTRDPNKIRERGGTDFAFTVWLCGLWISQQPYAEEHQDRECAESKLGVHLSRWLRFLRGSYPYDDNNRQATRDYSSGVQESDRAQWFDPVRNQVGVGDNITASASTVATYMDAIHATIDKHPQNMYDNPEVTAKRLDWCYHVIKLEGVWFPNLTDKEGDDEWVLFLEHAEDQT